jgi:DNA (cytosine-5)-methyltransferase 1
MFIHPTQNRSLTPREAARVQTFPDWFRFPASRTHAFRLIGNAVPPLVAEAVGLAIGQFLELGRLKHKSWGAQNKDRERHDRAQPASPMRQASIARVHLDAPHELERLAKLSVNALRTLPNAEFVGAWHALLQLFPNLHPNNALDHGAMAQDCSDCQIVLAGLEPHEWKRHARSGWPVALTALGREAWRRYQAGKITKDELYRSNNTNVSLVARQAALG